MTKFKVGDKVQFIENYSDYKIGDVVKVTGFWGSGIEFAGKHGNGSALYERFKLAELKPTKNQRITALENEVAELKLIVHELRGKKPIEVSTPIVEDKPLTPNQQRAAIIEKAKAFVKNIVGEYDTFNTTVGRYKDQCVRPIFHVNEKKRAITVLIYGAFGNQLIFKGITKCNPNDVFNEYIGKAIALGRALGLDVSEFEQAVQPTVAVGQLLGRSYTLTDPTRWKVDDLNDTGKNLTIINNEFESLNGETADGGYLPDETWYKIVDDTNANYKEG